MKLPRIVVYQGTDGQHYWRLTAANGRIVADSGEGYTTHAGAMRAARALKRIFAAAITP